MPRFPGILLVSLGTLLLQVQPVRATLRMPAGADCCARSNDCCESSGPRAPGGDLDCSVCLPGCVGCALLPARDEFSAGFAPLHGLAWRQEQAGARRDPPPLPPPRRPGVSVRS